jgi:FkbH-like protein
MQLKLDDQIELFAKGWQNKYVLKEHKNYSLTDKNKIKVAVIRDFPVEIILNLTSKMLNYEGIEVEWIVSPYDHTFRLFSSEIRRMKDDLSGLLVFFNVNLESDLTYYTSVLNELTEFYKDEIFIFGLLDKNFVEIEKNSSQFKSLGREKLFIESKNRDFQSKLNYPLLMKDSLTVARNIYLNIMNRNNDELVRCLSIDLDNTLYSGVLVDDGILGINVTPEHIQIMKEIKSLKDEGILIMLNTKNREEDVLNLFNYYSNQWPLSLNDFILVKSNFKDKSSNLLEASKTLNFDLIFFAHLDDSSFELKEIEGAYPGVKLLFAQSPEMTIQLLTDLPIYRKDSSNNLGNLRFNDIKGNVNRNQLIGNSSTRIRDIVFKELETTISARLANINDLERIFELSNKTNQFNCNLSRLNKKFIVEKIGKRSVAIVSVRDNISESGDVAILCVDLLEDSILVIDYAISCRVLGRQIETDIFLACLDALGVKNSNLHLEWKNGPKNQASKEWLNGLGIQTDESNTGVAKVPEHVYS